MDTFFWIDALALHCVVLFLLRRHHLKWFTIFIASQVIENPIYWFAHSHNSHYLLVFTIGRTLDIVFGFLAMGETMKTAYHPISLTLELVLFAQMMIFIALQGYNHLWHRAEQCFLPAYLLIQLLWVVWLWEPSERG